MPYLNYLIYDECLQLCFKSVSINYIKNRKKYERTQFNIAMYLNASPPVNSYETFTKWLNICYILLVYSRIKVCLFLPFALFVQLCCLLILCNWLSCLSIACHIYWTKLIFDYFMTIEFMFTLKIMEVFLWYLNLFSTMLSIFFIFMVFHKFRKSSGRHTSLTF